MQNLILNNMQPKVQLNYERGSRSTFGSAPGRPLASVVPTDHSLRCGAKPGWPCPIATRTCLQLGELCARTDQNQTQNTWPAGNVGDSQISNCVIHGRSA